MMLEPDFDGVHDAENQEPEEEEVVLVGLDPSELEELEEEEDEELSFEDRFEKLRLYIKSNPRIREINYKILKFCREPQLLEDVEERIGNYPEFKSVDQSQYFIINWLVEFFGLVQLDLDEEGNVVTDEQKDGLTEDEVDDLVVSFAFETTEEGRLVIEELDPKNRMLELLEIVPEYYDTYIEVLDFLTDKKSLVEVDNLLRGRGVLAVNRDPHDRPIQPSVFVDKLEKAGGLIWDEGWQITTEGKELLETIKERVSD